MIQSTSCSYIKTKTISFNSRPFLVDSKIKQSKLGNTLRIPLTKEHFKDTYDKLHTMAQISLKHEKCITQWHIIRCTTFKTSFQKVTWVSSLSELTKNHTYYNVLCWIFTQKWWTIQRQEDYWEIVDWLDVNVNGHFWAGCWNFWGCLVLGEHDANCLSTRTVNTRSIDQTEENMSRVLLSLKNPYL